MTSKPSPAKEAYVWIWLPGETDPVVAGRIEADGDQYLFNYGKSYLNRSDRMPIYLPELPLEVGTINPEEGLTMPGALRDGLPDAWGRRVIINKMTGYKGKATQDIEFDELTYMLESGSDRIGALDFQASATNYIPRSANTASLEELLASADRVEKGIPLTPELDQALRHGSSIGGARPKATIRDGTEKFVAKFSSTSDTYSVVKAEFLAMHLAKLAGLSVAPVKLVRASGKDVLLIKRFDRQRKGENWTRRPMVSALTLLGLDEMMVRYTSYEDLAEIIRRRFTDPELTLRELFGRLTFNILVGNTDDHARNHAAFWDGTALTLTPAFDICPQQRTGWEANQAMLISGDIKESRLGLCMDAAHRFFLNSDDAKAIMKGQVDCIRSNWDDACDEAKLTEVDRNLLWKRQFLNGYAFEDNQGRLSDLQ
ncbi:MAG: type II toxin-antitoxin system HipA family toxin [Acidobacteria bacterium]|uniref:Type II toxin-antitoxin system HipA family toxin n=1 Tax=Candidatus Polarisedimenticola svalbardensis TaxID=2886004 RepID=A0A8J6Y3Y8_9BACT|nr:type II toxin-antitoxin system HipA family toxin [Candidatus Polarisedimenticola svalbardensis]